MESLAAFERLAYSRRPEALGALIRILRRLATGGDIMALLGEEPPRSLEQVATRLAAAATTLLSDPGVTLDQGAALQLSLLNRTLANVCAAGGFETTDALLQMLGARDTESLRALAAGDRQAFVKAALLLSIDSALPIDVAALLEDDPLLSMLVVLGLVAAKPVVTAAGQARRDRLLELAGHLRPAMLPGSVDHLVLLSSAWMLCSYAGTPGKHAIKRVLNGVLRDWAARAGLQDAEMTSPRARPERPTMLVAAEIMHSNHVQYRYFGQYLRQLRTRFRLVLLTEEAQVDAPVRQLYDEVLTFRRGSDATYLGDVVAQIGGVRPDLIFWLSVGMRHWGPPLANLRLAPIQFTSLGHSASTFCDTMDYYLTEEGYVGDPALFGEKLVLLPDASLRFERSPHYMPVPVQIREGPAVLRIALPSNLLKLNPGFVAVLRRVVASAGRPLEFHVFPNVSGLELAATQRVLGRQLPNVAVHPVLPYSEYLKRLGQCDLNLSPFPFGGLHSVVDSLRQGLPVVALEGLEPHARTDAMLLRRLKMPEALIAQDVEGYVAAALRVVGDDALRVALSGQAAALEVDRVLYGDATTPLGTDVVDAAWWMYRHHEAIMASPRRVFRPPDFTAPP